MTSPFESPSDSSPTWAPGSVLAGRYRVEGELGRGGWGIVLAVTDEQQRPLALKLLLHDATDEALRRFAREAEVIRALHSAHVCRIHDTGSLDDGSPFIVMDRLVGDDLDVVLRRAGPLPIDRAVDYVMQACDAIAEAHLNGVVHRDIKPSNLFLVHTPDGDAVKVLDFGIAKARRTDLKSLTGTGMVLGSPYYMPPEQLIDSREVDTRADIWALGVTLFELITAQPCFRGEDVGELFTAVLRDEPIPLTQLRPEAPPALGQVLARCLEKLPEDRYDTVAELTAALEPFATERGRLLSQRIRALTYRRSAAYEAGGPTALLSQDVAAPTAAPSGPTHGAQPSTPSYPSYPSHPGSSPYRPPHQPSSLGANVVSASPREGPSRWGMIVAALAAVSVLAVAVVVAVSSLSNVGKTTTGGAADLPEACLENWCDFKLDELSSLEPAVVLAQARALAGDRIEGVPLYTYVVAGIKPDGTFDDVTGSVSLTYLGGGRVVVISIGADATGIVEMPSTSTAPPGDIGKACPLGRALDAAREAHPNAGALQVTMIVSGSAKWIIQPDPNDQRQKPWNVLIEEGCVMQ